MAKCSFCGKNIEKGTGKIYAYTSGKVDNFCSNKCEKNKLKLGRKNLVTKWTEAFRSEKSKKAGSSKK